jgi:hypothetical protein
MKQKVYGSKIGYVSFGWWDKGLRTVSIGAGIGLDHFAIEMQLWALDLAIFIGRNQ